MTLPDSGWYPQHTPEDYFGWDAASNSRLSDMARSAAYCRWRMTTPRDATEATEIGDGTHLAILQPAVFEASVWRLPADAPKRPSSTQRDAKKPSPDTVAAIKWWDDWATMTAGKLVLTEEQYTLCERLREACGRNPEARDLLARCTTFETPGVWRDDATGEWCKALPDARGPGLIVDLKTTRDAGRRGFLRSVVQYRYHGQAAWYGDAVYAIDGGECDFAFLAIDKTGPLEDAVMVWRLSPDFVRVGREQNAALLAAYADCRRRNEWPGRVGGVLDVPPWLNSSPMPAEEAGEPDWSLDQ